MKYLNWDHLFPNHKNRKKITMDKAQWQTLTDDTMFEGIVFAKGSQFKVFETTDFGWVVFHRESRTPDGNIPNRFLFKY